MRLTPWLELNLINPASFDRAVRGLRACARFTDTAIVSTSFGARRLYADLIVAAGLRRDFQLIPGLKTDNVPPAALYLEQPIGAPPAPFRDSPFRPDGWCAIFAEINRVLVENWIAAGREPPRWFMLENETLLSRWFPGDTLSTAGELLALAPLLPQGVGLIWNPGPVADDLPAGETNESKLAADADRKGRVRAVYDVVADEWGAALIDGSRAHPAWHGREDGRKGWEWLQCHKGARVSFPMLYQGSFDTDGGPLMYYQFDQLWPVARELGAAQCRHDAERRADLVIVYPGAARWVECCEFLAGFSAQSPSDQSPSDQSRDRQGAKHEA